MKDIKSFIPTLKNDFFVLQNNQINVLIDSILADIIQLGKEGALPIHTSKMKLEVASIKKNINRIKIIKMTDFIPSVFISIKIISIIFLAVYCLLAMEPWWGGLILVSIFTFVIFSILYLIRDMEDPFEYDGTEKVKSDEISLEILDDLQAELNAKNLSFE